MQIAHIERTLRILDSKNEEWSALAWGKGEKKGVGRNEKSFREECVKPSQSNCHLREEKYCSAYVSGKLEPNLKKRGEREKRG